MAVLKPVLPAKVMDLFFRDLSEREIITLFSSIPDLTGKSIHTFREEDKKLLANCFHESNLTDRSLDHLARFCFLLVNPSMNFKTISSLFAYGELRELVCLYSSLAYLPEPQSYIHLAKEGLRSSATDIFQAIACSNPYPELYFDDSTFHNMVLKCIFLEIPLNTVTGIEKRSNSDLINKINYLYTERIKAGRSINLELLKPLELNL